MKLAVQRIIYIGLSHRGALPSRRPLTVKTQLSSGTRTAAASRSDAHRSLFCTAGAAVLAISLICQDRPALAGCLNEVPSSSRQAMAASHTWAVIAGLLDFGRPDDAPPIAPFTVSGSTSKKYTIERMQGEKILSRKQGITTVTCVRAKPLANDNSFPSERFESCVKAEAPQVAPACASSCQQACSEGVAQYTQFSQSFSGFAQSAEDVERTVKGCSRRCVYECAKPGDGYEFALTSRRR